MLPFLLFLALDFDFSCQRLPPELNARLNNIAEILQDKQGYLWFAGQDGLFRYDGYELTAYRYNPEDPTSLSSNWVTSLCEDKAGYLWVGTFNGGLCRLDPHRTRFTRFGPQLPGHKEPSSVSRLFIDGQGILWVGLSEGGLARFEDGEFTYFIPDLEKPDRLAPGRVRVIFEEGGYLWIASSKGGLNRLDRTDGRFTRVFLSNSEGEVETDLQVWSQLSESPDVSWLGTNKGLFLFDSSIPSFKQYYPRNFTGPGTLMLLSLSRDRSGLLWGGSNGQGAVVFDPGTERFRFFPHEEGKLGTLPHNHVKEVFMDRTGVLWFGTLTGGVSKTNTANFGFRTWQHDFTSTNSISDSFTKVISQDGQSGLWVGGNQGLDHLDRSTGLYRHYVHDSKNPDSLNRNQVRALIEDNKGFLWIGLWGGGLDRFDRADDSFTHYQAGSDRVDKSLSNWIECLLIDTNKNFWVGSVKGLAKFTNGRFEAIASQFSSRNDLSIRVRVIYEAERGRIYLGCNYGMAIFDELGEHNYVHNAKDPTSLSNNLVRSILRTRLGTIWIGTSGGLNRFDPGTGTFTAFTEKDGLANNVIYAMLEDDAGRLWMGTNNGLSYFEEDRETFTNYTVDAGLQGSEFNNGAALRSGDGLLFFGGTNGITWFDPSEISPRHGTAPLVISGFKQFDKSINYLDLLNERETLVREPNENFFSFEFALLDFGDPSRNHFQYMMEGIDEQWSKPSNRHYVNYPNMDPGDYQLRVRGTNSGGLWDEKEITLKIHIKTPLIETGWFQVLAWTLFLALLIGWLWMVLRSKQRLKDKVLERTQSLKQANENLATTNIELKKTREDLLETAHQAGMAEVVIGVVHNIGNVLNSVSVSAETLTAQVERGRCERVTRVAGLLKEHQHDLVTFLTQDPQGKNMIPYLSRLSEILRVEKRVNLQSLARLKSGIGMLRDTVRMQQGYAKGVVIKETLQLRSIAEDMLSLHSNSLIRHNIQVAFACEKVASVEAQRFKLAHIFTNLITNAIEAIDEQTPDERQIRISIFEDERGMVRLNLRDSGRGIAAENLKRVFRYGFTTKKTGKGFGLHSCANSMSEMGGSLMVTSEGLGKGTTFSLSLPKSKEPASSSN